MALETKLLTFTANTTTGDQDLTGTTFTPKTAIVWTDGVNNAADTFSNAFTFCYGFTDGTNSRCINIISEDNQASSDTASSTRNDSLIYNISATDTATARDRATFVQWLSTGMRINWATAAASAFKFHVLFLGGADITNVEVGTFAPDLTTAGSKSQTGMSFQPDFLMLMHDNGSGSSTLNTISAGGAIGIGAASSITDEWSITVTSEDNRTQMDTWQYQDDSKILSAFGRNTGTFFSSGDLTSFNSDGFTVNFSAAWGLSSPSIPYLAIKGGVFAVGKITEPGGTGNQTTTTNTDVKAVHLFGIGTATQRTSTANNYLTVGAGTSSSERAVTYTGDLDNALDSVVVSRYETTSIYLKATPAATATSSTIDEEADLDVVAADGFTLNWSNVGGALQLYYVTFGNATASTSPVSQTRTHKFNILSKVTQSKTHVYSVISKVTQTKTHKYHVQVKLTVSKTHKWNIIKLLTVPKTHIYDVEGVVTSTKTHRYDILNTVPTTTKTHKYDIVNLVGPATKTHKYNLTGLVTTTKTHLYNVTGVTFITYTKRDSASADLSNTRLLSEDESTSVEITENIPGTSSITLQWASAANSPNKEDWENGNWVWRFRIITSAPNNTNLIEVVLERISADGTTVKASKSSGAISFSLTTNNVTHSDTIAWNDGTQNPVGRAADDRFRIKFIVENTGNPTRSIGIGTNLDSGNDEISTPLIVPPEAEPVSTTTIHKYDITSLVTKQFSHLYDITGYVTATRTHRFDVVESVSTSKTHKFDLLEQITKSAVHVYNITGLVSLTKTHKYDILQQITQSFTHLFNILESVSTVKTHEYNILQGIEQSFTHIYNILERVEEPNTHKYDVIGKVTTLKTHRFDVIESITTTKTHKYDVTGLVRLDTTHKYDVISAITAKTTTHKYDIESETTVQRNRTHKFNILEKVTTTKTHEYNIIEQIATIKTHVFSVLEQISTTKTHKFNTIQLITTLKTHAFSVLESLSTLKTHLYNVLSSVALSASHKYNIIGKIIATKTHIYDVESAVSAVSTTKTHKFDIEAATTLVTTTKTHLFDVLQHVTTSKTHEFNILETITRIRTHKFNVIAQLTTTYIHKFNIIGKLTTIRTHIFNIVTKLSTTKTHKYNILTGLTRTRTHKYNIIGRLTTTRRHRYDMGGKVTTTKTHRYVLGAIIFRELGGSTNALIRFPQRVQILDVIGDINNLAIANLEISPINSRKIITIGTVQISDYPFNILTASASENRSRHRIASSLILPPIIDTIENQAVCHHIGIDILQPSKQSQIQLRCSLRLREPNKPYLNLTSRTQIKQDSKTIIKVSAATTLKENDKVMNVASIMIPPILNLNKIVIPEIMTLERVETIKTLIHLLKSDEIFNE